jgi:hypothetical protein
MLVSVQMARLFQCSSPRVLGSHQLWVVQVLVDPVGNSPVEDKESAGRLTLHTMRRATLAKMRPPMLHRD